MNIDENVLRNFHKEAIPDDYAAIPEHMHEHAKEVLGSDTLVKVKRNSQDAKLLLCWSKNERNKRKRARKAQRKARKG
jgi:hypothetical protein